MTNVDITNTANPSEPKPEKYTIPFKPELIDLIQSGAKVETYRFGIKHDYLQIGDAIKVQNSKTKEVVCDAVITSKYYLPFIDLPTNSPGHEPYASKEQQREVFSGYYAYLGRPIQNDDQFIVFEFQVVKLS